MSNQCLLLLAACSMLLLHELSSHSVFPSVNMNAIGNSLPSSPDDSENFRRPVALKLLSKGSFIRKAQRGVLDMLSLRGGAAATADDTKSEGKIKGTCIGIDLGTTYSCVAVWRNGRVEICPNEQGNRITPSYVAWGPDGQRLVGDSAKNQAASNPTNTVFDVKRLIGRKFSDSSVQTDSKLLPYKIVAPTGDKPMVDVQIGNENKILAPEEVSAMILRKMKETAETFLGEQVHHAGTYYTLWSNKPIHNMLAILSCTSSGYGSCLLQRCAASGHQRCGHYRRTESGARVERAHRGCHRIRSGQEQKRRGEHPSVRSGRRNLRCDLADNRQWGIRSEGHSRRHPPGRRGLRPAHDGE